MHRDHRTIEDVSAGLWRASFVARAVPLGIAVAAMLVTLASTDLGAQSWGEMFSGLAAHAAI